MVPEGCLSQLISLMAIKFNSEECCHDSVFNEEIVTKCKKATALYNKFNLFNVGVVRAWSR